MPTPITTNTLFYGDNLPILREYIADSSVDMVYLDPPFNSDKNYSVLFKDESGRDSEAQIVAFQDTWHWGPSAENTYRALQEKASDQVARMIEALRTSIGTNQMMAYLVMMTVRLIELHRVLKPTGSLWLHCDPTASHYLKIILDSIFGAKQFRNEIVWHYSGWNKKLDDHFESRHDVILFYGGSSDQLFHSYSIPWANAAEYIKLRKQKVHTDEEGEQYVLSDAGNGKRVRRYIKDALSAGSPVDDVWGIDKLNNSSKEKLGYPTQKPMSLLERIIQSSTNPGDLVLDPFAGCGTTIAAAQHLGRRWIGIDITHLAIALLKYRLKGQFSIEANKDYKVQGEPKDFAAAQQLALDNRYQFQWWALSLVKAQPQGGNAGSKEGKKGSDQGIDGLIRFPENNGTSGRVIVQVKSGKVSSQLIRDLRGTIERDRAAIGLFITLDDATGPMLTEAASAGNYQSPFWGKDYPRIQILTIAELLKGAEVKMPPQHGTFKQAPKATTSDAAQGTLDLTP